MKKVTSMVALILLAALGCGDSQSNGVDPKDTKGTQSDNVGADVSIDSSKLDATDDLPDLAIPDGQLPDPDARAGEDAAADITPTEVGNGDSLSIPDEVAEKDQYNEPPPCNAETDKNCVEIRRGESVFYRYISEYPVLQFDDKGTVRTVIHLYSLIDEKVVEDPTKWRYEIFGTDGYTFGGFAQWDQMLLGYMEVGERRVVWEPALELPDSWRVKDAYLILLSPAGG